MTLQAGTRLGPYEVLSLLGTGGMGEVWKARDPRLHRDVVIKTLRTEIASDADRIRRFEQESRSASALNHPNIITIYDVGSQDGTLFIAMELVEGATLRELLSGGDSLPTRKTLDFAFQICEGLARAHAAGIVHRDLKPENVMVSRDGVVKILDFGLAKLFVPTEQHASVLATAAPHDTHEGTVLGTVGYMSPEQASGRSLDYKSDQFSFGAILYELATGRRAFQRNTTAETLTAIIREEPEPVASLNPRAPAPLRWILERCLAKDPEDRYASTLDLARDLRSIRDHLSDTSTSGEAVPAVAARRRFRGLLPATAIALAALGVGFLWGGRARNVPPPARTVRSTLLLPENVSFGCAAVSPDGARFVFSATDGAGTTLLWVRALDAFEARTLPGTEGATLPFWSPDGRAIGFFASGKLKTIEASGGPAVALWDVDGAGGTWNQSGDILFSGTTGPILRIPAAGGKATPVTKINESRHETNHRYPQFLPGGRRFLYLAINLAGNPDDEANQIRVGSLDSQDDRAILRGYSRTVYAQGYLLFVRGGTFSGVLMAQAFDPERLETRGELVRVADTVGIFPDYTLFGSFFPSSDSGVLVYDSELLFSRLLWFDRSGQQVGSFGKPGVQGDPRISPDGQRIAYSAYEPSVGKWEIWIGDLVRGVQTRLTNGPSENIRPVWSPDGQRIAFASDRKRQMSSYVKPSTGGGGEELLWEKEGQTLPDDWSPDGRFLLHFSMEAKTTRMPSIDALSLFGDRRAARVARADVRGNLFGDSRFSPDGRWVAYESDDSGRAEVYATSYPGSEITLQISSAGGMYPTWRRDGRELFYLAPDGKFMSVEIEPGRPLKAGVPRPLFQMPIPTSYTFSGRYDVAPDGQRFLVNVPIVHGNSVPLNLVVNWTAELHDEK